MTERITSYESEVINAFHLTNSEWMRYRLVDELPERANAMLGQRYTEQMLSLSKSRIVNTKRPKELPGIDFSSFEVASVGIIAYTDEALASPQLNENVLKGIVENLARYSNDFFIEKHRFFDASSSQSPLPANFAEKADEWIDRLQSRIQETPPQSKREQALVIAALFSFETEVARPIDRQETSEKMLNDAFVGPDFELLEELLMQEYESLDMITLGRIGNYYEQVMKDPQKEKGIETGVVLLSPLVRYANDFIEKQEQIDNVSRKMNLLEEICDDLGWHTADGQRKLSEKKCKSTRIS